MSLTVKRTTIQEFEQYGFKGKIVTTESDSRHVAAKKVIEIKGESPTSRNEDEKTYLRFEGNETQLRDALAFMQKVLDEVLPFQHPNSHLVGPEV